MRPLTTWTVPLLLAVLLAGCTSRVGAPASTSTSTPMTSSTPSRTTTSTAPITAADGADLTACGDADCEVLINAQVEIPLGLAFGCTRFAVAYFTPNRVAFNVDCTGAGYVTGYFLGRGALRLANSITMEVDKIDATGAVLHFLPKSTTKDPGRNEISGEFGAAFT